MKKLLASTLALAFIFTACSGSDDATNKEAVVKMAAASLEAEAGFYSEEYTECLLDGIVEIAGVSWSDIQEALELDGTLDSLAVETSVSEDEQEEIGALAFTCMADADILQDLMDDAVEDIISSGGNYGDDPYLDSLYDQCADGDDQACDDLYWESPYGSEYESFALTCGGRGCEIETPNTVPWGGGSLDLDALYADCSDGNDDACVLLSDLSPDSEIREFAKTCGGRGGNCSSFG